MYVGANSVDSDHTALQEQSDQNLHRLPFCLHLLETLLHRKIKLFYINDNYCRGWSGGAKVLCKLSVPGRPTNLGYSRAGAYCACSRCGWGMFGHFFSRLSFLFSFSLCGRRPDID